VKAQRLAVWLPTAAFLAAITALGQLSGLKLLLFPELGALASVVFSDPASAWARSPRLLLLTPFLAAVAGILVSSHDLGACESASVAEIVGKQHCAATAARRLCDQGIEPAAADPVSDGSCPPSPPRSWCGPATESGGT
jgi:hypothetical protein